MTEPAKCGKLPYENKAEHGSVLTGSRFGCSQVNTKGSLGGLPLAVVCPGRDIVMVIERRRIPSALSYLCEVLWRCFTISKKEMPINEEIREKEVRVIGPDGSPLGIMSSKEALQIAQRENLDLVNISPKAVPPVCKIMNYGKYRFEQAKREKEAKKKQKTVEIKEIRLSLKIDTHDFETKVNQAKKFLEHGDRVKVAIRFRGREMAHPELGNATIKRFADACADVGVIDKLPKMEGRSLIMFISAKPAPKAGGKAAAPKPEKQSEQPAKQE